MATTFGRNVPKYGAWHKSNSIKYDLKFQQKYWRKRTVSFAPFTYASTFAHCTHRLVKLKPGANVIKQYRSKLPQYF
jgi:hypothetical protein